MIDRHSQAHNPYNASRHLDSRPTQLPMPILRGRRDPYEEARRQPIVSPSSTSSEGMMASPVGMNAWDSRQYGQGFAGREQPPVQPNTYIRGDTNKPSLPSLRTVSVADDVSVGRRTLNYPQVLGENARSPPSTPHPQASTLQPRPREPSYDQSTYKPSSLYPNKRTRTDSGWDGQVSDIKSVECSPRDLQLLNSHHQNDRHKLHHQLELPNLSGGSPEVYRHRHSTVYTDDRSSTRELLSHHASPESRGRAAHLPTSPRLALPRGFEAQNQGHVRYHPQQPRETARDVHMDGHSMSGYDSSISHSRSPSLALADDRSHGPSMYGHSSLAHQSFRTDDRRHSLLPAGHHSGYREDYSSMSRLDASAPYAASSYPYAQAFFVPSHYEYQNGKSRKRSNLPKQSTEIMKRWFGKQKVQPIAVYLSNNLKMITYRILIPVRNRNDTLQR